MPINRTRTLIAVWLVLVVASLSSWQLGQGAEAPLPGADALVMAFTAVKAGLVGAYFMELRHAPRLLAGLFYAWVALVCAAIIALL